MLAKVLEGMAKEKNWEGRPRQSYGHFHLRFYTPCFTGRLEYYTISKNLQLLDKIQNF
ncbi:hypothetical protein PGB90_002109 [Kerria lacca]